jgi:DNA-binding beta-propeller fold protein YncE
VTRRALALLALLGLSAAPARGASTYAFVTGTDFLGPGCASWVALDPPRAAHPCVATVSSDPVARWAQGYIYVVNRYGADNIQVLDPAAGFATALQFSVGNGTNPQDIAVLSAAKAYVSLLNASYLLVVDPQTGAPLDSIPLDGFADADGIPEAHRMLAYGGLVFLSLQRLTNFAPSGYSLLVVIDAAADTVMDVDPTTPGVQGIRLTGTNPNSDFAVDETRGVLLLGETGAYGVADGGVDAIDPVGLTALGFETTEAQLGGEVGDVALAADGGAYAAVSGFHFTDDARLVRYDRATGAPAATLLTAEGPSLADLEVNDRGELWVCDRSLHAPGLRVFDAATGAALAGPIDVGASPFDVCFGEASGELAGGPGLTLLGVWPNPARGALTVRYAVGDDRALPVRLEVFDARGTRVGRLEGGAPGAGEQEIAWPADAGWAAPPGAYFFRLVRGAETAVGRFVLLGP